MYAVMLNTNWLQPYAHGYIHRSNISCSDEPTSSCVLEVQEPTAARMIPGPSEPTHDVNIFLQSLGL